MIELRDLLTKWNNTLTVGGYQKESIREAIATATGIKISTEDIEVKNNIIYLNIKPIYKNEILIKKDKIDSALATALGKNDKKSARDIR